MEAESSPQVATQQALFDTVPAVPPVKPFIKWVGGKTRLLPRLLPFVPATMVNYHEPFLGGGAMFFAVANRVSGHSVLSDLNQELVNAWLAVRDHPSALEAALDQHAACDSEEYYYSLRPVTPEGTIARAARFIYLNQTSWNGLWRVNKHGVFNVPWGRRPFRGLSRETMDNLAEVLTHTDIGYRDFRDAVPMAQPGDFVYLDPPYLPISDTSKFHLYTEKRFKAPDLNELADLCADLSDRGVNWMMSNRFTPQVSLLFSHATIVSLTTRRSVAAQNRRDVEPAESAEAIVMGGPYARTASRSHLVLPS